MTSKAHEGKVEALFKNISSFEYRTEDVHPNEAFRAKLLQTAKRLVSALEKPADAVFHNAFLVNTRVSLNFPEWSLKNVFSSRSKVPV